MNMEAYNLDSLRRLVRSLQDENKRLKEQLDKANIPYDTENVFVEKIENIQEYDPDQGGRILNQFITRDLANRYFSMFWGRTDVYARRGARGGYFPQCNNRWNNRLCPKQRSEKQSCEACGYKDWTKLTPEKIISHLLGMKEDGSDVLGVYPLFADGTCRFLVFDFDNHEKGAEQTDFANVDEEWHDEVDALRMMCEINGITPLVERSRSGRGAHVWIFFKKPVSASLARNFGFLLLDKGSASINLKSFHYYDRMYPSQDATSGIGNLIALSLQGRALKDGNSAFVDKNWNAYPDQWDVLLNRTEKLGMDDIERLMAKWQGELAQAMGITAAVTMQNRPKPWKKKDGFVKSDVVGNMHIVLGAGIYVDTLNLMPRLQNQIRSMAAFDNPIFYKNKRLGYSNYNNFSAVYMGKDVDGYIAIPRGLRDHLILSAKEAGIEVETEDLILLQSKDLLEQWVEELNKFLAIDEEPPLYKTKTGREKRRDSVIGILHGNKNTLTGIIDVAMVGSMYGKGKFNKQINSYGMVIMDECHHAGSTTAVEVLQRVNAKYVYGVTATPKRGDNLEKIIHMLLGPIRHSYNARERALEQGIGHYVYPRYTRVTDTREDRKDINGAYALIGNSTVRNDMILEDTRACVKAGRTPVILTRYKEQAKYLHENLQKDAGHVFLFYGDNSDKENSMIRQCLKEVSKDESLILVATGQKIGEGFDHPRLDTLMLAAPVSFEGRLEQYIGRLNRDYEGKKEVVVYDYIDSHIQVFDKMYAKRLRTYKRIGFELITNRVLEKQNVNAIYDSGSYTDVFEQDIAECGKQMIVSSPEITRDKVERFLYLVKARQEAGCKVTVITIEPQNITYGSPEFCQGLIDTMRGNGIHVIIKEEVEEHFAVLDDELVWHGGMNLLGKEDVWDNLMRVRSAQIAAELLEIALKDETEE